MLEQIFSTLFSWATLKAALRFTTPILLASLGAIFTARAGVLNLNLEGTMLAAALGGVLGCHYGGSLWTGVLAAILVGVLIAAILAWDGIYMKSNMVLAGTALNTFVSGLTIFVLFMITDEKGTSTKLTSYKMPSIDIPLIKNIPVLGEILSGHSILTYFAFICVFIAAFLLFKTAIGLRIRAVGENPDAAESVGVNVKRIKAMSLIICGFFASLGGAYLSMDYVTWFQREMTSGRGFIALAAMNLGNSHPVGTMLAAMLFGAAEAIATILQSLKIPYQLVLMIPYFVTLIGLIVYAIRREAKIKKLRMSR